MSAIRRRVLFAAAAGAIAVIAACGTLLAVDVYLHGRYEQSAGFNVWGYRGNPVGKKQRDEYRVVVLGGSATYGYGVKADEAIPAVLERLLRARAQSPRFTVVNLGYNNEGAYSFKPTLEDYRWLDYDLAVLYEGYNDLATERINVQIFRHDSPLFRLTGYMPIFPIIFKEKAAAMVSDGDAGALYRQGPATTVFHASLATKAQAGVLDTTANVARSLEAQLGRVSVEPAHRVEGDGGTGCGRPWGPYCQSMAVAVQYARAEGKDVLVATQPYLRAGPAVLQQHRLQQAELRAMVGRRFAHDASVGYADFAERVDLADPRMSFDQMHLTVAGNQRIAEALVDPVIQMASRRRQKAS